VTSKFINVKSSNLETTLFLDHVVSITAYRDSFRIVIDLCTGKNFVIKAVNSEDLDSQHATLIKIINDVLK